MSIKKNRGIENCNPSLPKYDSDELDLVEFFRPSLKEGFKRKGSHDTIGIGEKGAFVGWRNKGCQACIGGIHGSMYNSTLKQDVKYLCSSLWDKPDHGTRAEFLAYWKLLFDKEKSPWRQVLEGREWVKDGNKLIGYKLDISDKPFQVVANLAFAVRMPYAQQGYLRSFTKFCKAGFDPVDALYLCANMAVTTEDKIRFPYIGDYPFDTCFKDIHYKNWVNGTPIARTSSVNCKLNFLGYRPVNSIWHAEKPKSEDDMCYIAGIKRTKVQELVAIKTEYTGSFGNAAKAMINKQGSGMPFAEAASILLDKRGEWAK